jgi:hypothetical protein
MTTRRPHKTGSGICPVTSGCATAPAAPGSQTATTKTSNRCSPIRRQLEPALYRLHSPCGTTCGGNNRRWRYARHRSAIG